VGSLPAKWIAELQPEGRADLSTDLHRFPDLKDAIIPAGFECSVEPDARSIRPVALHRQGLGRRMVENLAYLGRRLSLAELRVEASKIGRWAWARWGFEWMDVCDRDRVVTAAAEFARALGRSVDLSGIEQPGDFARLTDTVLPEEIRAAGGPPIDGDRPVILGKALMLGPPQESNRWFGRFRL
jgi:hypothetical protein